MNFVFYQGQFLDSSQGVLPVSNRSFHFADGFFESIRVINGKACFLQNHFNRIEETMEVHKMDMDNLNFQQLENEIQALIEKNEITQGGRVRLTISRKSEGFYLPEKNDIEYIIEAYPFKDNYFKLNEEGKAVDIFPGMKKDIHPLSMFKNNNCSLYIQASLYAKEKNLDISLIQNVKDTIIEASNANIFIVSNRVLYTPSLSDGCTAGTMRMNIINLALENGLKTYETALNPQYLLTADEVFLTNAIRGITWVSSYRSKRYFNNLSKELIVLLNKYVSEEV